MPYLFFCMINGSSCKTNFHHFHLQNGLSNHKLTLMCNEYNSKITQKSFTYIHPPKKMTTCEITEMHPCMYFTNHDKQ